MPKAICIAVLMMLFPAPAALAGEFIDGVWNDEKNTCFYIVDSQARSFTIVKYFRKIDGSIHIPTDEQGNPDILKADLEVSPQVGPRIFLTVTNEPVSRTMKINPDGSLGFWRGHGTKPDDGQSRYTVFQPAGKNKGLGGAWSGTSEILIINSDKKVYRFTEQTGFITEGVLEIAEQNGDVYLVKLYAVDKYLARDNGDDALNILDGNKITSKWTRDVLPKEALEALK